MDELPTSLAALVSVARAAHDPRPADARRVGAALSAAIPGIQLSVHVHASSTSGALASGGTTVGLGGAVKWIGVLVAVAAAGAAMTTLRTPSAEHATRKISAAAARVESRPSRAPIASTSPSPNSNPIENAATNVSPASSANTRLRGEPASTPKARARRERGAASPATTAASAPPAARATTSEELPLIRRAAEALRDHDPALARQLLDQHEVRFPDGALKQERLGMKLVALCEEDKLAEASALRDRFLAENPDSPMAARVQQACRERAPGQSAGPSR
jgi:hypothetical protein